MRLLLALAIVGLALVLALLPPAPSSGEGPRLRFIGAYAIPTGEWTFGTMPVGGLSGLTYDPARDLYYAVSDDRGETGTPGRLYTLRIALESRGIRAVWACCVTFLDSDGATPGIQPYPAKAIDAEEVVLTPRETLLIASERDQEDRPWIREFGLDGALLREIPLPEEFQPSKGKGVRRNLAIEGLALSPDGRSLFAANEQALAQDGPLATVERGTIVRLVQYDLSGEIPRIVAEYPYLTEPIFAPPQDGYADNGVSAILYVKHLFPRYDLFVLERAFSEGIGNDIKLFGVRLAGADNVKDLEALPQPFTGKAVEKQLLLRLSALREFSDLPIRPDNIEAIALGPRLPNGHYALILASDNNFNPEQVNLFLALELVP
ncbi:MAG: esterase-like activity of phytase family protein [Candidatus Bipolaricaulia bacterium]